MNNLILVEDNPADAALARIALEPYLTHVQLTHCRDGNELLELLATDRPASISAILLDLNMPRMNGFEVLRHCYADPELRHLPIIVFSSSTSHDDVQRCYDLGANAYVAKPMDMATYDSVMRNIVRFWVELNLGVAF